jgi:hypothetical protein
MAAKKLQDPTCSIMLINIIQKYDSHHTEPKKSLFPWPYSINTSAKDSTQRGLSFFEPISPTSHKISNTELE